jgi:nucleotide-binding universal stress UspA family protein
VGPLLCCVDNSDGARAAVRVAKTLASKLGLDLVLVHVEPPADLPGVSAAAAGHERLVEEELERGTALVARLARETGAEDAERRVAVGPTAEAIIAICEEKRAELVVLGSHGRAGLRAAVLGSVSGKVAAAAPCPCLVVPPTAERPFLAG